MSSRLETIGTVIPGGLTVTETDVIEKPAQAVHVRRSRGKISDEDNSRPAHAARRTFWRDVDAIGHDDRQRLECGTVVLLTNK